MTIKAVLFDLDGTLLDTAGDLIAALNYVLQLDNKPPLTHLQVRNHVSQGAKAMLSFAYGCEIDSDFCQQRWQLLVDFYRQNLNTHTVYFDGMETVLNELENSGIKWGIVTNKPAFLTDPLAQLLGLDKRTNCIISGDTLAHRKPHPAPVLHACDILQCAPCETVFVGDDERDIVAGREAGTKTLAATYGYILPTDQPNAWQADMCIDTPLQILNWINQFSQTNADKQQPFSVC